MPSYRVNMGPGRERAYVHLNMGSGRRRQNAPKHCRARCDDGTYCGGMQQYECDWPACDKPLCRDCAFAIGKDYHLCPEHRDQPGLDIGEGEGEQQLSLLGEPRA